MILLANGLAVLTLRMLIPWTGVWTADMTVDGLTLPASGPLTIAGEEAQLVCTIDPAQTATFVERMSLGVIGGGGGWGKTVLPKHYHSDAQVQLATVVTTTAAEVKEPPPVVVPVPLGKDYVRVAGPASQVLAGRSWWVGLDGITVVGPRPPKPQPVSFELLDWDVELGIATAQCDGIIEPGTVIVDVNIGNPRVVRDVELTMTVESVIHTLWLVEDAPQDAAPLELAQVIGDIAKAAVRPEYLRLYECRVIAQDGERLELQPVDLTRAPAILPASVWAGVPGVKAKSAPGSLALVGFRSGDPLAPYVAAFEDPDGPGWMPLELELDASVQISLGKTAAAGVAVGAGTSPVALAPALIAWAAAVVAACAANTPPIVITPLGSVAAQKLRSS